MLAKQQTLLSIDTKLNDLYSVKNALTTLNNRVLIIRQDVSVILGYIEVISYYMADFVNWNDYGDVVYDDLGIELSTNFFEYMYQFIEALKDEKEQNSDSNSYAGVISGLTSDESTIFGQVNSTKSVIEGFVGRINGSGSSTISVSLGSAEFYGADVGGWTFSIGNSWFAPYKSYSDAIISAFIWLSFIWSLFRNLGSIIEGNGMKIRSIIVNRDIYESMRDKDD